MGQYVFGYGYLKMFSAKVTGAAAENGAAV
jgi:hypothetical protein